MSWTVMPFAALLLVLPLVVVQSPLHVKASSGTLKTEFDHEKVVHVLRDSMDQLHHAVTNHLLVASGTSSTGTALARVRRKRFNILDPVKDVYDHSKDAANKVADAAEDGAKAVAGAADDAVEVFKDGIKYIKNNVVKVFGEFNKGLRCVIAKSSIVRTVCNLKNEAVKFINAHSKTFEPLVDILGVLSKKLKRLTVAVTCANELTGYVCALGMPACTDGKTTLQWLADTLKNNCGRILSACGAGFVGYIAKEAGICNDKTPLSGKYEIGKCLPINQAVLSPTCVGRVNPSITVPEFYANLYSNFNKFLHNTTASADPCKQELLCAPKISCSSDKKSMVNGTTEAEWKQLSSCKCTAPKGSVAISNCVRVVAPKESAVRGSSADKTHLPVAISTVLLFLSFTLLFR